MTQLTPIFLDPVEPFLILLVIYFRISPNFYFSIVILVYNDIDLKSNVHKDTSSVDYITTLSIYNN